jgi:hypothetical protein
LGRTQAAIREVAREVLVVVPVDEAVSERRQVDEERDRSGENEQER